MVITFLATIILQKHIAATYKIFIPLTDLGKSFFQLKFRNTYKPNYKELEIELLGTFFLSMTNHIPLKLDINAYLQ